MCDVLSYAYDYCIKINKGHVHTRNIKYFLFSFEIKNQLKKQKKVTSVRWISTRHQLM